MASTPSASALSAVLRCRGNIWSRNPSTKRPGPAYSLGLTGAALRDYPPERPGSQQASAWEASPQGERAVEGRRLSGAYRSGGKRDTDSRGRKTFCHQKISQSSAALACQLTSNKRATVIVTIHTQPWRTVFVQDTSGSPAGVWKLSVVPWFVLTGWSTLKTTCCSLTALVSRIIHLRLTVLCGRSGPDEAARTPLLRLQDERRRRRQHDALQASGQIHASSEDNSGSGQKITQDRPD